jgi:hypothetical protein
VQCIYPSPETRSLETRCQLNRQQRQSMRETKLACCKSKRERPTRKKEIGCCERFKYYSITVSHP